MSKDKAAILDYRILLFTQIGLFLNLPRFFSFLYAVKLCWVRDGKNQNKRQYGDSFKPAALTSSSLFG